VKTDAHGIRGKGLGRHLAQGALLFVALLFGCWVGYGYLRLAIAGWNEPPTVAAAGNLADTEQRVARIFREVAPSVVLVVNAKRFPRLVGPKADEVDTASGFVWDADGHIVTNNLVVTGADLVQVRCAAGRLRRAAVLGSAPEYGLAVLRVEGMSEHCKPIPRGSSDELEVGQAVFAIGNPFGLWGSLTQGLVSALRAGGVAYAAPGKAALIQTDALINPGDAGGPLLDSAGRLIGVNVAYVAVPAAGRRLESQPRYCEAVAGDTWSRHGIRLEHRRPRVHVSSLNGFGTFFGGRESRQGETACSNLRLRGAGAGIGFAVPVDLVRRVVSALIRVEVRR